MITNPRAIGRTLKTGANTFALLPLKWDSIQIDQKPGKISQGHKFYLKRYSLFVQKKDSLLTQEHNRGQACWLTTTGYCHEPFPPLSRNLRQWRHSEIVGLFSGYLEMNATAARRMSSASSSPLNRRTSSLSEVGGFAIRSCAYSM